MALSLFKIFFWLVQYATGYHPWPVAPPTADEASFILAWRQSIKLRIVAEKGIKVQKEYISGSRQRLKSGRVKVYAEEIKKNP